MKQLLKHITLKYLLLSDGNNVQIFFCKRIETNILMSYMTSKLEIWIVASDFWVWAASLHDIV